MVDFFLVSFQQRYPTNSKADGTETDLNLDQKVRCKGDQQCKCLSLDCTAEITSKYSHVQSVLHLFLSLSPFPQSLPGPFSLLFGSLPPSLHFGDSSYLFDDLGGILILLSHHPHQSFRGSTSFLHSFWSLSLIIVKFKTYMYVHVNTFLYSPPQGESEPFLFPFTL